MCLLSCDPRSLESTLPGGSGRVFQLCRTEDILLGFSSGSAQAEQGCNLGYTLYNVFCVLEPLSRHAKGSTGTCQGVSVSRTCCCQDDVKVVGLWGHYWPGSSQSLSHWVFNSYNWILLISLSLKFSPLCSSAWKEIRNGFTGAHGGRWMGTHWVSSWDKITEVTSTSSLLYFTAGCSRQGRDRITVPLYSMLHVHTKGMISWFVQLPDNPHETANSWI